MSVCPAITRKGTRCTQIVDPGQEFCHRHDPDRAEERQRAASKGGKAKASPLARELHGLLEDLTTAVVNGELLPYRGAVAAQLINARIRLIETERRIKETEELIERLDALEGNRGGAGAWGA